MKSVSKIAVTIVLFLSLYSIAYPFEYVCDQCTNNSGETYPCDCKIKDQDSSGNSFSFRPRLPSSMVDDIYQVGWSMGYFVGKRLKSAIEED